MVVILTKRNLAKAVSAEKAAPPATAEVRARGPSAASLIPDDAKSKLLKLIPGEAAVLYTTACGFSAESAYLPLTAFILSGLVLILTIRTSGKSHVPPIEPEPLQYIVRMAAFVAWAFAIRNPLEHWTSISVWVPALAVLFIPIIGSFLIGGGDVPAEPNG